ncbi:efflux RND transporter periplasmic adaptor subunit [Pseudoflavonifractor capillosus]|uniref:efflux RND transporter periplasmic adaptor subunit n=1 Tax=Pseudoflavonifractor capillosus TaxID=106588 RepID=UPI0019574E00|nr:HlyD family efflux transporter periplasmic adaptor subunit [Pseudoflavonifractor capillosus]MBM6680754.1 HlyD family efflux transporter periplasmic adaptor subunit [Pseudoflavonifractor capillosus]
MKLAIKERLAASGAASKLLSKLPGRGDKKPGKKRRWKKFAVAGVALVVAAGVGWQMLSPGQSSAASATSYTTAEVTRMDVSSSITGSGTLEAADSYSVTTLIEGSILTADFEEGDEVEEGTILYTIDSSDASNSLEQAEISLNQAQRSYNNQLESQEDLIITSPVSGQVYSIDVEVGDDVSAGETVATIRDSQTMSLEVSFPADAATSFYVGQSATVTLDSTFETLTGTISEISGTDTVLTGNVIVRTVTIDVSNPGGLSTEQTASAAVGTATSTASGTFTYKEEETVTAQVSGEVSSIRVSEGDQVSSGQTLIVLTSNDLDDSLQSASESLRNAEISLENQYENLDDYTITSPIKGTIVDKNYNAGETTEANQVLCTIYDLSYLTMTLSVDELDIASIEVGQSVSIVADAVEDTTYTGTVTKVSVAGTSSGSATTYPVTIRIDETDGLLPGMSVDATIELASAEDVLAIPSAALNRGDTVLVTADSPSAANGTLVESTTEDGEDYYSVEVTTGVSGDDYIEIVSGLQEGDTVAYIPTSSSSSELGMMGGMPGGMGGGMPGGGGGMGGGPGF